VRAGCGNAILPPFTSALEVMNHTPIGSPILKARADLVLKTTPAENAVNPRGR